MTKIKLCGLSRPSDISAVNELLPDYIGFVFAKKSKRYVTAQKAAELKALLNPRIKAVGVFCNELPETVANLLNKGFIDIAQLHGDEDESFIKKLRTLTDKPIIKAFCINSAFDITAANESSADFILVDSSSAGSGKVFDWQLLKSIKRPFFLAGGISKSNVSAAIKLLQPYAVDVSSGIEINGLKSKTEMTAFVDAVRKADCI